MEPEVAEAAKAAATSPGVLASIVAAILAGMGWLTGRLYRSIGHRIKNVEDTAGLASQALASKADKKDVEGIREALRDAFRQQRGDKTEILGAITSLTTSFNSFAIHVEQEIGKRPTRDELKK